MNYIIYAFEQNGIFNVSKNYTTLNGNCIEGKFNNKGKKHHFILNNLDKKWTL